MENLFDFEKDLTTNDRYDQNVKANKQLRKDIDKSLQNLKSCPTSDERDVAIIKLKEATMWLGLDLKRLGEVNPYPNSRDTSNIIVDKTADNLEF